MPANIALIGVGGMAINIVNRVLSHEHLVVYRSIIVDWDAKQFSGSPAGEKIEIRADLCAWPLREARVLNQEMRLKGMLEGMNLLLLTVALADIPGMEEFLQSLANVVDESGLISWAVVPVPRGWESEAGDV